MTKQKLAHGISGKINYSSSRKMFNRGILRQLNSPLETRRDSGQAIGYLICREALIKEIKTVQKEPNGADLIEEQLGDMLPCPDTDPHGPVGYGF